MGHSTHTHSLTYILANNLTASFTSEVLFTHKYINKLTHQASEQQHTAAFLHALPGSEQTQRLKDLSLKGVSVNCSAIKVQLQVGGDLQNFCGPC